MAMIVAAAIAIACGGKVDGSLGPASSSENDPNGAGSGTVGSSGASKGGGGSTGGGSSSTSDCITSPRPECDRGDVERATREEACVDEYGVTCYDRVGCHQGQLWCQHYSIHDCAGVFRCADGWNEVKACTDAFECESKTTCGYTIWCQKVVGDCEAPEPKCGSLETRISGSSACRHSSECVSRSNECGRTIWCQKPY